MRHPYLYLALVFVSIGLLIREEKEPFCEGGIPLHGIASVKEQKNRQLTLTFFTEDGTTLYFYDAGNIPVNRWMPYNGLDPKRTLSTDLNICFGGNPTRKGVGYNLEVGEGEYGLSISRRGALK